MDEFAKHDSPGEDGSSKRPPPQDPVLDGSSDKFPMNPLLGPIDEAPTVISKPGDIPRLSARPTELARGLEGEQLGHYRLDEFVGGGGMGAVFRGYDLALNRTVAVKVVPCDPLDDDTIRRFKNEAQSAARLDHERIARVFNVGADDHWHYIVFEFIEGVNVRDLVQHKGTLSLEEALLYARQVAEALDHACSREVIHRDIKPSNVLVMQDGTAKVVDFGLARLHHGEAASEDLTQSGMMFGTFDYIPPEQARDPRDTDVRSDLYSLGCTLYFMLVGQPPFPDGTVLQKLLRHSSEAPDRVELHRPDIPKAMGDIIERLLQKNQEDRFQSPQELMQALDEVASDAGITLGDTSPPVPETTPATAGKWHEHVAWLAPVMALALIAVALEWPRGDTNIDAPDLQLLPALQSDDTKLTPLETNKQTTNPQAAVPSAAPSTPNLPPITNVSLEFGEATLGEEEQTLGPPATMESLVVTNAPVDPQRIIVLPASAPKVTGVTCVTTVNDALRRLNQSSELSRIELHFSGEMEVAPIRLAVNRDVEIVAAGDNKPVLVFAPTGDDEHAMLSISAGKWTVRSVSIEMRLPLDYPSDLWAMFQIEDSAQRLDLMESVLTVQCDDEKLHRAAFLRFVAPNRSDMPEEPSEAPLPVTSLNRCLVRGHASLVQSPAGAPLICDFVGSLLASSGYVLEASGAMVETDDMPTMQNTLRMSLKNSTVLANRGLAKIDMQSAAQLPGLNIYLESCAVDCPGTDGVMAPGLIIHRNVNSRVKANRFTQYSGIDNLIRKELLNHHMPEAEDTSGWVANSIGVQSEEGPQWIDLPEDVEMFARLPSHFQLQVDDGASLTPGADLGALPQPVPQTPAD